MKKKIIIEMIGMPGSGKSYIQNYFLKKLKKYEIKKKDFYKEKKFKKIVNFILFILRYPIFTYKNFFYIYFKLNNKKTKLLRYFLNEASLRISNKYSNKHKIIINDEGFFYRSLEYFKLSENNQDLSNYLNNIPEIDILIFVNTLKKNCLRRVSKRKNHNFKYDENEKKIFNEKTKLIQYIINFVQESKKVKIIRLDNNKLNIKSINKIVKIIRNDYENIAY
jgi:thymidylate kinase